MLPMRARNAHQRYVAPQGRQHQVGALHVAAEVHDGIHFMVSKWEPTPDELQRLFAGAPVVLGISAQQHPVVFLSVDLPPA